MPQIKIGSTVTYLGRQFRIAGFNSDAAILEGIGGMRIRVALKHLENNSEKF